MYACYQVVELRSFFNLKTEEYLEQKLDWGRNEAIKIKAFAQVKINF